MAILRVKQRLGQNILLYGRFRICFLTIVNVTYVTQCFDIKSSIVVQSWKKKKKKKKTRDTHTHIQNGTLYFLIMVVRVS